MTIQAAAGYPQLSGTAMALPIMSNHMIMKLYQKTIFGEISTTEYTNELARGGDTVVFRKEPNFVVRDGGGLGSTIRHDTAQWDTVSFTVGRSMYYSLSCDPLTDKLFPDVKAQENMLIDSGARKMAEYIDKTILNEMYLYADAANRGTRAGKITRSYNLGAPGTPIVLTSSNILEVLTRVRGVMAEQNVDLDNEDTYLIVPPSIEVLLMNSDLKAAYFSGLGQATYTNGRIPNKMAGLNFYKSNRAPLVYDATVGGWCYILSFGTKRATAFISLLDFMRRVDNDANTWQYFIQARAAFDFFVLYGNLTGYLYVKVF